MTSDDSVSKIDLSGDIISIKSTGKITGEVFYENISIEEGAVVEAQVGKRKNKEK